MTPLEAFKQQYKETRERKAKKYTFKVTKKVVFVKKPKIHIRREEKRQIELNKKRVLQFYKEHLKKSDFNKLKDKIYFKNGYIRGYLPKYIKGAEERKRSDYWRIKSIEKILYKKK